MKPQGNGERSYLKTSKTQQERSEIDAEIRQTVENILMDTMFELPSEPDINEVVINEEVVTKGTKPILVHEKKTKEIKSSI